MIRARLSLLPLFLAGVFLISLGVAVTAKALLGATPIAAIPYSLSLLFPAFSFGVWVMAFNIFLLILEYCLLKGAVRLRVLATQGALALCLGTCVDFSMFLLLGFSPHNYWQQLLWVAVGTTILATGVMCTLRSNIAVLPGDGFVLALATVTRMDFGRLRLFSDLTMALAGLALCGVMLGDFAGVREGTIIAALLCGPLVKLLLGKKKAAARTAARKK